MKWIVELHDDFLKEFEELSEEVQDSIYERSELLAFFGAGLGRPYADTLKGSLYQNMKELRLGVENGVWRVAFAFDPKRKAILLIAGDKKGKDQKLFYKKLIKIADRRFKDHLDSTK